MGGVWLIGGSHDRLVGVRIDREHVAVRPVRRLRRPPARVRAVGRAACSASSSRSAASSTTLGASTRSDMVAGAARGARVGGRGDRVRQRRLTRNKARTGPPTGGPVRNPGTFLRVPRQPGGAAASNDGVRAAPPLLIRRPVSLLALAAICDGTSRAPGTRGRCVKSPIRPAHRRPSDYCPARPGERVRASGQARRRRPLCGHADVHDPPAAGQRESAPAGRSLRLRDERGLLRIRASAPPGCGTPAVPGPRGRVLDPEARAGPAHEAAVAHAATVGRVDVHPRHEGAWNDPNGPYHGGLQMDAGFMRTYGSDLHPALRHGRSLAARRAGRGRRARVPGAGLQPVAEHGARLRRPVASHPMSSRAPGARDDIKRRFRPRAARTPCRDGNRVTPIRAPA